MGVKQHKNNTKRKTKWSKISVRIDKVKAHGIEQFATIKTDKGWQVRERCEGRLVGTFSNERIANEYISTGRAYDDLHEYLERVAYHRTRASHRELVGNR